jgi:hypothetical protein
MRGSQIIYFLIAVLFIGCENNAVRTASIKNKLSFARNEVITITLDDISPQGQTKKTHYKVTTGDSILSHQLVDINNDSSADELLIYAHLKPNEEKEIRIESSTTTFNVNTDPFTFSRFVPERTDDYAWENDLVAFRTYGPVAQQLVEQGKEGGTLSSGLDCWLKRVHYPVINKWYKKYTEGGTYHKDDGEGYDPYHVGKSRGCGGIVVWKNDSLYVSKNFISYRKIIDGPIRNVFELTYAPWGADGITIRETKQISIDAGNQLYKVKEIVDADGSIPNITIGLTLHDKKGRTFADSLKGVFGYWEPVDDAEIGTGIVIDSATVISHLDYRTEKKDLSHLYVIVKPRGQVSYYTGFAWSKAGAITTDRQWINYLDQFSQRLRSPIFVQLNK